MDPKVDPFTAPYAPPFARGGAGHCAPGCACAIPGCACGGARAAKRGGADDGGDSARAVFAALVVVLLVVLVVGFAVRARGCGNGGARRDGLCVNPDYVLPARQDPSVYRDFARLYTTDEVDPLVTGQLYAWRDNTRDIYSGRVSHGSLYGLQEFSSATTPGAVGVDIGPLGLAGPWVGYDDGIPENYAFPSTPIEWYRPRQRDFYGPEGPTPYVDGMYPLTEPDHEPLM